MKLFPKKSTDGYAEAMATVVSCHYDVGAGQAMAFGIPRLKRFQITFNYWANGELHTGEFASAKAVPQGTLFPIRYDPAAPHENTKSEVRNKSLASVATLVAFLAIVAVTSAVVMHGCTGP